MEGWWWGYGEYGRMMMRVWGSREGWWWGYGGVGKDDDDAGEEEGWWWWGWGRKDDDDAGEGGRDDDDECMKKVQGKCRSKYLRKEEVVYC